MAILNPLVYRLNKENSGYQDCLFRENGVIGEAGILKILILMTLILKNNEQLELAQRACSVGVRSMFAATIERSSRN